ncbi:hypothetical protein TIFTF001_046432 [Ficus carica]|uniref:Retrotransposon gag domain-containing protein n=1 Tax=Ficus carica TaxID=3494 RepID=A0AA87ZCT6_FICCA|nr:hypothetical protein TIFTF001_046432 [Ficus carica]
MQPLFASEDTPVVNERRVQPRQTAPGTSARQQTTPTRRLTTDLPQPSEDLIQPGTNVEEMMRNIMYEEMRTLEAQMQQRFTSQIHKATTSTPGFDDLARGVRETPLTSRITNTITPKFGRPHESLHAYIKRFSKAISEISGLDDGTAREALKKGLRHWSLFKNEICARYPSTIQDALHRAKGFIELEEENERAERDLARTREEVERSTRREHKRPLSPPKYALGISPSELIAHLKRQDFVTWPKKLPENPARDTSKYCEFHKDHGHNTIDCRALRAEVAELLKKGHLREFLTEKGRETYGLGGEAKERRVVQQIEDMPSPPPVRKTIGVICGGSIYNGETVTAIKSHRRKATQPIAATLPDDLVEHSIIFHSSEATSLSRPHDDACPFPINIEGNGAVGVRH